MSTCALNLLCILAISVHGQQGTNCSALLPYDAWRHTIDYAPNQAIGRLSLTHHLLSNIINRSGILQQLKETHFKHRVINVILNLKRNLQGSPSFDILELRNSSNEYLFHKYLCGFYGKMEYFYQSFFMSPANKRWKNTKRNSIVRQTVALKRALKEYKERTQFDDADSLRVIVGNTSGSGQIADILNKCRKIIERIERAALLNKDYLNGCYIRMIIPDIRMMMERMVLGIPTTNERKIAQGWRGNILKVLIPGRINLGGPEFTMSRITWRRSRGNEELEEMQKCWRAPQLQNLRDTIVDLMENDVSEFMDKM